MSMLHAQGLNKRFGAVVAAADINIRIERGERVSLIGSNGAGKTTFVNMIDNMLVANACHDRRLSFFQSAQRREAIARAEGLLERFRLAEHRQRRVSELPGGVRKLLDIAMALTTAPKLLLLDEPTSGVSADEKFPMMETIMAALDQQSDAEKTTVLFVEHDMDIVERYADRVIAFYSGRIIADDKPAAALATDDVRRYVTGELLQEA